MRILVTGSREWSDVDAIRRALLDELPGVYINPNRYTVVHGGAPGADHIAGVLAHQLGLRVEVHPARWDLYGKSAGPIRNALMVTRGADVCLAFPLGESIDTRQTMKAARAFGIEVVNYGDVQCGYCGCYYNGRLADYMCPSCGISVCECCAESDEYEAA